MQRKYGEVKSIAGAFDLIYSNKAHDFRGAKGHKKWGQEKQQRRKRVSSDSKQGVEQKHFHILLLVEDFFGPNQK